MGRDCGLGFSRVPSQPRDRGKPQIVLEYMWHVVSALLVE